MRWSGRIFWLLASALLPAFTPAVAGIGLGKSYPVTAAQLLPAYTGFLAPIHFFKLAKNWAQNYCLAIPRSRFIYLAPSLCVRILS
jgi:hypothetical protein